MIPPSTGTPRADFWCSRLDNGADMNHPPSFVSVVDFSLMAHPLTDQLVDLVETLVWTYDPLPWLSDSDQSYVPPPYHINRERDGRRLPRYDDN